MIGITGRHRDTGGEAFFDAIQIRCESIVLQFLSYFVISVVLPVNLIIHTVNLYERTRGGQRGDIECTVGQVGITCYTGTAHQERENIVIATEGPNELGIFFRAEHIFKNHLIGSCEYVQLHAADVVGSRAAAKFVGEILEVCIARIGSEKRVVLCALSAKIIRTDGSESGAGSEKQAFFKLQVIIVRRVGKCTHTSLRAVNACNSNHSAAG